MKKYSLLHALFTILMAGVICATVLIFFSPGEEYIEQYDSNAAFLDTQVQATQNAPSDTQKIIGLLPGHYGFDSGYQCGPDYSFVQETDVNLRIAVMVRDYLNNRGYTVNLLQEFDPLLSNYTALALISIHNDSCDATSEAEDGFRVTTSGRNAYPAESKRLNDCLRDRYAQNTGLSFLGSNLNLNDEMVYSFDTVNDYTTISLIETGYLSSNYRLLSERMDLVAKGIGDGIICYVENEPVGTFTEARSAPASGSELYDKIYKLPMLSDLAAEK